MSDEYRPAGLASFWGRAFGHLTNSVVEANRAAAAAFGAEAGDARENGARAPEQRTREPPETPATAFYDGDWEFERTTESRAELGVGDTVRFAKTVSDGDVRSFATATGDTNRLHLDDAFAGRTRFGGRIAHGTLVAGLISAALARLPGLTIYLSQDLTFEQPVGVGDRVEAVCEIVEALGGERYRLTTCVYDEDGEAVIDGEAVVLIDDLPEGESGAETERR